MFYPLSRRYMIHRYFDLLKVYTKKYTQFAYKYSSEGFQATTYRTMITLHYKKYIIDAQQGDQRKGTDRTKSRDFKKKVTNNITETKDRQNRQQNPVQYDYRLRANIKAGKPTYREMLFVSRRHFDADGMMKDY